MADFTHIPKYVSIKGSADVSVNLPYLVADLLLVLLPLMGTVAAEQDDGEDDEDQQNSSNGSCDDVCSVDSWAKQKGTS